MITLSPNTLIKSADLNANFIEAQGISGFIGLWPGSVSPTGWLLCQGQAINRVTYAAIYAVCGTLYGSGDGSSTFNLPDTRAKTVAGYKSGDSNFGTLGASVGEATHTLTAAEVAKHTHPASSSATSTVNDPAHVHTINNARTTYAGGSGNTPYDPGGGENGTTSYAAVTGITVSTSVSTTVSNQSSGDGAHNNIQPTLTMNYIIKI